MSELHNVLMVGGPLHGQMRTTYTPTSPVTVYEAPPMLHQLELDGIPEVQHSHYISRKVPVGDREVYIYEYTKAETPA